MNLPRPLVLAVDDDPDNLELISQLLALIKCSFTTAANGHTAIVMAQTHQPDLILLDIMLPDLNGLEVISRLKQDDKTMAIPIIAVTAMAREQDRNSFLMSGCIECVTKPYILDELEMIIHHYLF